MNKKQNEVLDEGQIRITNPFGPSIAWAKMPSGIIEELNNYIDKIINDKKKSNELDHGKQLAGNVTQEFVLEKDFAEKIGWTEFLKKSVSAWVQYSTQKKITEFNLINTFNV